jgi:hypothetical protein
MSESAPLELRVQLEELSKNEEFPLEIRTMMAAAASSIGSVGECRLATPYRPISILRTSEGLRYCCGHTDDQHGDRCQNVFGGS